MACFCCQEPACIANFAVREVTGLSDPAATYATHDAAWAAAVAAMPDVSMADFVFDELTYSKNLGIITGGTGNFQAEAGDLDYKVAHFNATPYLKVWWDEITDTYVGGVLTSSDRVAKFWVETLVDGAPTTANASDSSTWPFSPIHSWTRQEPTGDTPCFIERRLANLRFSCDDGYEPMGGTDPNGFPAM